tara:strand:- start:10231 stop:10557 length:327 start_codon:yes stop_codon:yes gene_type:complete
MPLYSSAEYMHVRMVKTATIPRTMTNACTFRSLVVSPLLATLDMCVAYKGELYFFTTQSNPRGGVVVFEEVAFDQITGNVRDELSDVAVLRTSVGAGETVVVAPVLQV